MHQLAQSLVNMTLPANPTICILGCGTMGIAISSGVLDAMTETEFRESGTIVTPTPYAPSSFIACVKRHDSAARLGNLFKTNRMRIVVDQNVQSVHEAQVVLLCTKPQIAQSVLSAPGMQSALEDKLVISILAGCTIERLETWLPKSARVIRAMPNTPCKIREGMTVLCCPSYVTPQDRSCAEFIFNSIGRTLFLDEKHIDAATALCGSGPAFACVVLEAMADGGVMMGLPRAAALELAAQTMQGAARMVLTTGQHPASIKDSVCTPGGCTIAGLLMLEDGKIRATLARTIQESTQVAAGLGASGTNGNGNAK